MGTNAVERKKACPRCMAVFLCCTEDCWCSKLPRIMPLSEHEDCLCYECLKVEIEQKIAEIETTPATRESLPL
jgi:hypothetical protein